MFTDFLRDQAFAIAWLGLMASAWFGWSQEDPQPSLRAWLGAGSVLGMLTAGAFGVLVWRNWATETALEGKYWVFGALVLLEIVLIGGCLWLAKRGMVRWYGWWIAACVALHEPFAALAPTSTDVRCSNTSDLVDLAGGLSRLAPPAIQIARAHHADLLDGAGHTAGDASRGQHNGYPKPGLL